MEQLYQWFENRKKTCLSFSLYLTKFLLKMIGWKDQEPGLLQPFLVWAKTSSFNVSHFIRSFIRSHTLFVIKTGENPIFFMLSLSKSKTRNSFPRYAPWINLPGRLDPQLK